MDADSKKESQLQSGTLRFKLSDASELLTIGIPALEALYAYATSALERSRRRFESLDSKASQTVGSLAIVGGILGFALSSSLSKGGNIGFLLYGSLMCFVAATALCLLCLRVRSLSEPSPVDDVLTWLEGRDPQNIHSRMLCAWIVDLANAEKRYLKVCVWKSRCLSIAWCFEMLGIVLLVAFVCQRV